MFSPNKNTFVFLICFLWVFYTNVLLLLQSDKEHDSRITEQRVKQLELIEQLKSQLEDLETYAYEVKKNSYQ